MGTESWVSNGACELIRALRNIETIESFSLEQWDRLVRQARRADLLGRLAALLTEDRRMERLPVQAQHHLIAARTHAGKHHQVMRWEIGRIQHALQNLNTPVVFLKGAGYVLRALPPSRGRVYADVDIMVPKQHLGDVEKALLIHGWAPTKLDAYDQRYYRQWMHEIPPMRHRLRHTVIDVHHRILPETTRAQPDPRSMFERAEGIEGTKNCYTLAPVDMLIHSAAHLFYESEYEHGLRDLVDLDDLFRLWATDPEISAALAARARELELETPLYYALRYCSILLGTPIPEQVYAEMEGEQRGGNLKRSTMDALFLRGLLPSHRRCQRPGDALARFVLYVRGHALRMPLHLLIPHLVRKSVRRDTEASEKNL